jgi:FAD-dependent urate hydroxylase
MLHIETAIIGAGPYGLSIAAHLRAIGLPFQIFGTPLESWQAFMPEGMFLKSEPFASTLWDPQRNFTLKRFLSEKKIPYRPVGTPVSLAQFLDYAEWFRKGAVGEVCDIKISRIRRNSDNFTLDLTDGSSLEARRVVLATGPIAFRYLPPEISGLPEPLCKHSTLLSDVKAYSGRDCTIVGAGQSALESAALLHEAGATVRVLARADRIRWNNAPIVDRTLFDWIRNPEAGLGAGWQSLVVSEFPRLFRWLLPIEKRHRLVATSWGPSGSWWLRERVEGKMDLLVRQQIRSASDAGGRIRLLVEGPEGRREILTDRVIAATGFKVDLDRLDYLDAALKNNIARENHAPVLDASFETSVPGLFLVGALSAPTFGPVMRFIFGAKHAAPILARRLAAGSRGPEKSVRTEITDELSRENQAQAVRG